jgi:pyruvate kinase
MLSGETAFGEYPIEAVKTMADIAQNTESSPYYKQTIMSRMPRPTISITDSVAYAATESAKYLKASAIITATQTGYSARKVSKYKPQIPVLAVTNDDRIIRQLTLSYGIYPVKIGDEPNLDSLIKDSVKKCLDKGYINNGDIVVISAGILIGIPGGTNIIKIHIVAKELAKGTGIGKKTVKGHIKKISCPEDYSHINEGDILVIKEADADSIEKMKKAGAILTEESGMTSFTAIIGRELEIPVVVALKDTDKIFNDGMKVTVDSIRGIVYEGYIKLPTD